MAQKQDHKLLQSRDCGDSTFAQTAREGAAQARPVPVFGKPEARVAWPERIVGAVYRDRKSLEVWARKIALLSGCCLAELVVTVDPALAAQNKRKPKQYQAINV